MKVSLGTIVNDFKKRSIRRRRMISLVTALSMFIASGVVWELRSVGITMVNDVGCGIEEHTHNESCYSHEFICDKEESSDSDETGHVHDVSCFEEHLSCELEEHRHTVECYDNEEEYLLLNQVDEPEEMPVVEFDSEYTSDDEDEPEDTDEGDLQDTDEDNPDEDYEEGSEEDEDTEEDSDSEDDEDADTDPEDDEDISEIIKKLKNRTNSMLLPMSLMDIAPESHAMNTIYQVVGTQLKPVQSVEMSTGDTLTFCIYTEESVGDFFYTRDEKGTKIDAGNPGVVYSKNGEAKYVTNENAGNRKERYLEVQVTAQKPGNASLHFYNGSKDFKVDIVIKPVENLIYLVELDEIPDAAQGDEKYHILKEIPNATQEKGAHYSIEKGHTIAFCIYSQNNGDKNSGQQDFFYSGTIEGSDVVTATESSNSVYDGATKRFFRVYTGNSAGKIWVGFDKAASRAYLDVFDPGASSRIELKKPDGQTVTDLSGYSEANPFTVFVGQKFEVYGYDVASSREWIYCSFDTDKSEIVTLNYNNSLDSDYSSGRKVAATFTAAQPTLKKDSNGNIISNKPTKINFSGKSFYIRVNAQEASDDKIYVITALGEREKDKITETFDADKPYQPNSQSNRYLIWLNETVELCFYSSGGSTDLFEYDGDNSGITFIENKYDNDPSKSVSFTHNFTTDGNTDSFFTIAGDSGNNSTEYYSYNGTLLNKYWKMNSAGKITFTAPGPGTLTLVAKVKDGHDTGTLNVHLLGAENPIQINTTLSGGEYTCHIPEAGKYEITKKDNEQNIYCISFTSDNNRNYAEIKGIQGGEYTVKHKTSTGYEYFYINVVGTEGNMRTHADIEITDGGFYEFRNEVEDTAAGTKTITIERYDTKVTGINHCYLYGKEGNQVMAYEPSNYEWFGSEGGTQYELTSAFHNGELKNFHYWRKDVNSARFDISITLVPSTRTVTVVNSSNNSVVKVTSTDISGNEPKMIPSAIFSLGLRSVIDAVNKCPQHNGLDFNISACLNTIATNVEFKATKNFIGNNNQKLDVFHRTYTFELVDKDGQVVSTAENNSDGKIVFSNVLLSEGTYEYTVREKIPEDTMIIDDKKYQHGSASDPNGVFYDQSSVQYKVVVSNTTGIVESSYYKVVGNSETAIDNFTDAFNNEVVKETYEKITVEKQWSDGVHNNGYIAFRVYLLDDSNKRTQVVLSNDRIEKEDGTVCYEDGIFYVGANQNWKTEIEGIPVKAGDYVFRYEIEELNVPSGYLPSYDTRGTEWKIINSDQNNISISVKKEWYDVQGNKFDNNLDGYLEFSLIRERREVSVPVTIRVKENKDGVDYVKAEHTVNARIGGTFSFNVTRSDGMNVSLGKVENCSCTQNNNSFSVTNVQYGAVIDLYSVIYRQTFDSLPSDHGNWKPREPYTDNQNVYHSFFDNPSDALGGGWSSRYFTGDSRSLKVQNRKNNESGVYYDLTPLLSDKKLEYNKTYRIVLYLVGTSSNFSPKLSRLYNGSKWSQLITDSSTALSNHNSGTAKKIVADYTIPSNDSYEIKLYIATNKYENNGDNSQNDFYVDDVMILPYGTEPSLNEYGVADEVTFTFNDTSNDKDQMQSNWGFERYVVQNYQLKAPWTHTFDKTELQNYLGSDPLVKPGFEYRYYVEEIRLAGYEDPSYANDHVASNTSDNPIIIKNKQIPTYYLPATGGTGPEKIQRTGLILIFFAAAGFILRRRIKRRSG